MLVGVSVIELHLPYSRSLKEKRKVVKGLVDRIHDRCKASVIESDYHDLHQRAEIAVAYLAMNENGIEKIAHGLRKMVSDRGEAIVTRWDEEIVEALP